VILDLEDAVGPDDKVRAREAASNAVTHGGFGHRQVVVRINALDTEWGCDDLESVAKVRPAAVLIPKVSCPADLEPCAQALAPEIRLWAMIETCDAILNLGTLGASSAINRCDVWIMGLNDLAKELRCRSTPDRAALMPAMMSSLTAARANGLSILDGVFNDVGDLTGFQRECRQGAELGFDGKTVIHPTQLPHANDAFGPSEDEIEKARHLVGAFALPENRGKGVIKLDGRMAERLHLQEAERLLSVAKAIAAQSA